MREQACFHLQQAAEKAVKAVLVKRGIDFPRTHDIAQLFALTLANRVAVPKAVRRAELLTPYAVQTRYPADLSGISDIELSQAQDAATAVVEWAQKKLTPPRPRRTGAKGSQSR